MGNCPGILDVYIQCRLRTEKGVYSLTKSQVRLGDEQRSRLAKVFLLNAESQAWPLTCKPGLGTYSFQEAIPSSPQPPQLRYGRL